MIDPRAKTEDDRLAALARLEILDTPPEPEFDELVEVAAAICEVPISMVTLVDEHRQWFKSVIGLDSRETSREVAFCAHAIQQPDMMTVEDATLDPRFADNPLVTCDKGIRFYAGVPLNSVDGHAVGTLCVIDTVPRVLTSTQEKALRVLGRQANARLEMREQRKALVAALAEAEEARMQMRLYQAELESANARLRELATTDPLTALANRRIFDERLAVHFVLARRNARSLSVMFLDIDNFKQCNDVFGHVAGDRLLQDVARVLCTVVRISDLVARYGGEEFVLLLPETDEAAGLVLGERILKAIRAEVVEPCSITLSGGVAALNDSLAKPRDLMRLADAALYDAKHTGKDRVLCYSSLKNELRAVSRFSPAGESSTDSKARLRGAL